MQPKHVTMAYREIRNFPKYHMDWYEFVGNKVAVRLAKKDRLNAYYYPSFLYYLLLYQHLEVFPGLQLS